MLKYQLLITILNSTRKVTLFLAYAQYVVCTLYKISTKMQKNAIFCKKTLVIKKKAVILQVECVY